MGEGREGEERWLFNSYSWVFLRLNLGGKGDESGSEVAPGGNSRPAALAHLLWQWFFKCGVWTSISISYWLRDPGSLCFHAFSGWFQYTLKFEPHCTVYWAISCPCGLLCKAPSPVLAFLTGSMNPCRAFQVLCFLWFFWSSLWLFNLMMLFLARVRGMYSTSRVDECEG